MISSNHLFQKNTTTKFMSQSCKMLHASHSILLQRHDVYFTKLSTTVHFFYGAENWKKYITALVFN